jgi:hypothetical protein
VVWNIGERRPYRQENSINTQRSIVSVDTIPEETDNQSYENNKEREEEAERRTALYGVWYVQSRTDDAVCSDQQACQEVSKSYDADS